MSTQPATAIDPVTLQVIATSLSGIVREVTSSLFRTGFSTIVRESQDGSCGLTDVEGRLIDQHVVLPLHCGAFPAIVQGIRRAYALDEIEVFLKVLRLEAWEVAAPVTGRQIVGRADEAQPAPLRTKQRLEHQSRLTGFRLRDGSGLIV